MGTYIICSFAIVVCTCAFECRVYFHFRIETGTSSFLFFLFLFFFIRPVYKISRIPNEIGEMAVVTLMTPLFILHLLYSIIYEQLM